jgi:hypothetical protein
VASQLGFTVKRWPVEDAPGPPGAGNQEFMGNELLSLQNVGNMYMYIYIYLHIYNIYICISIYLQISIYF